MRLLSIIFLLSLTFSAKAGDSERVELNNFLRELNKIERLIHKAKSDSSDAGRYRFRYDKLEQDLKKIKEGINDYLDAPKRAPKILTKPLHAVVGDY